MMLRRLAPWFSVLSLLALGLTGTDVGSKTRGEPEPDSFAPRTSPLLLGRTHDPPVAERSPACPPEMVLVEGAFCAEVEQRCLRWLDPQAGRFSGFRCAEYAPSRCVSRERERRRFCIDRDEARRAGEVLPENHVSLELARGRCSALGKRVCEESEWTFACEGDAMSPYPYGWARDASACNADRSDLVDDAGRLRDLRAAPGAHPRCTSPFGVRDMTGNLEEVVETTAAGPTRMALKGAYWQPGRNHCRAAQYAHDAHYAGLETGFRCCKDPEN